MAKKDKKKKIGFFAEFKQFINRGNVMNLAVGVIIGSAFSAITNSLVNHILMPFIGLISKDGFQGLKAGIGKQITATADVTLLDGSTILAGESYYQAYIYYGLFIQAIVNFILIALTLFFIVKIVSALNRKAEEIKKAREKAVVEEPKPAAPAPIPADIALLTEIRDLLKTNSIEETKK